MNLNLLPGIHSLKKMAKAAAAFAFLIALTAAAPDPSAVTVKISAGKLAIGKAVVKGKGDWQIAPFKEVLGDARERTGYNKTYSYDDLGIVLFEKKNGEVGSGKLVEIQIYFSGHGENSVAPASDFGGTLELQGLKLNSTTSITPTELRKKLKKWKETNAYMEHNFRFVKKGLYIYTQFNDSETQIKKVSVGPDKG